MDPLPFGEDQQAADVADVSPLGVHRPTPLEAEMSSEGLDLFEEVGVHHLTLTSPGAIGKDIHPSARRVLAKNGRTSSETASLSSRRPLSPALTMAFGQVAQLQSPEQGPDLGDRKPG